MKNRSVALILSGGGHRGALQVGALKALVEHDFEPDLIVGVSAGALNAVFLASHGWGQPQVERLAEVWRQTKKDDIYPGGRGSMLWRTVRGAPSLFPNHRFRRFLERTIPPDVHSFGDLRGPRAYIVASYLHSGELYVFGDDPEDQLLDALMASTAIPPLFPPWNVNGEWLIDGGLASGLPVPIALERGADELWGVHITSLFSEKASSLDIFGVTSRALHVSMSRQNETTSDRIRQSGGRYISVSGFERLAVWDFDWGAHMIAEGYRQASSQLQGETGETS